MKKRAPGEKPPDHEFGIDWKEKASRVCVHGAPIGQHCRHAMDYIPTIQRHQYCAYRNAGNGAAWHRRERIKMIWPSYAWHRWNERRIQAFSNYNWLTWLGPASSAKSTDAAIFGLEYWTEAPDRTAVIICSTTMKMLRLRIWSQVAHYHSALPANVGNVGELLDSVTRVRWKQGDDKNGIFGMAVEEGSIEEVVNNLIGEMNAAVFVVIVTEFAGSDGAIMGFPVAEEVGVAVALRGDAAEFKAADEPEAGDEAEDGEAHCGASRLVWCCLHNMRGTPAEKKREKSGPEHDFADFGQFGVCAQGIHEQSDKGDQ